MLPKSRRNSCITDTKQTIVERVYGKKMENLKYDTGITALLVIDPYNDLISEGGKVWDRLKAVAKAVLDVDRY